MIHLGDSQCDPDVIRKMAGCPVDIVRGNCDIDIYDVPLCKLVEIGGYRILLLHGHQYGGMAGIGSMRETARENDASIVMFGHTHIPLVDTRDGVTVVNPGSISLPRQEGRKPSYLVMNIENGVADFVPVYLSGYGSRSAR